MPAETRMDFFVPVIDNYGDVGFAYSLAMALLDSDSSLVIRLVTSDPDLVRRIAGDVFLPRFSCISFDEFFMSATANPFVATFFGYRFPAGYREHCSIRRELRFDYLQFHQGYKGRWWVASIHGTRFTDEDGIEITHFVPSWVAGGGGVVVPSSTRESRSSVIEQLSVSLSIRERLRKNIHLPWLSVFCYPHSIATIQESLKAVKTSHLVLWHVAIEPEIADSHEHIIFPFLSLADYVRLIGATDRNIVRGENSLVASIALGQPTLWDIYRESNGAHAGKAEDYLQSLGEISNKQEIAENYSRLQSTFIVGDEQARIWVASGFIEMAQKGSGFFEEIGQHVCERANIVPNVLRWIREMSS